MNSKSMCQFLCVLQFYFQLLESNWTSDKVWKHALVDAAYAFFAI